MKVLSLKGKKWKILARTPRSQAAEMVIAPGDSEGGSSNRHPKSDQWLYVISGSGIARTKHRDIPLKTGTLLLIEKGEAHEIRNPGRVPLATLNIYSPPAY